ncbi:formate dehydrogenase accessory sulfurtransferase FdhD [Neobacillus sp. SuZ13]|uniref:formate dehydrogenase accessory sulfurtransferase FdhD n=1 Tax=Neobacillus sp. SuZ13 TaxID=3047875 RepID=UPI0024BFC66A|nr:formate dehydrogenase accessory sulfurtransferase FdhD [Neobacillus sp. SuZ13]WHY70069.1 formate dehydrogenase accessory sulfurtransferase FdhD [Neobacillus sp. SuZ13]
MKNTIIKRTITRYTHGNIEEIEDSIVTEHPITIKLNQNEFATLVCTPEYIEDMVIGFLVSEGVIRGFEDIDDIWIQVKEGFAHVKTNYVNHFYKKFHSKRYITSCCGKSRQGFVFFNDAKMSRKFKDVHVKITYKECFHLMEEMQKSSSEFIETGGVHNASLCSKDGIILSRVDIGRHNALDKIYGYCLRNQISLRDKVIVFSGRLSSEILAKVAKIGCEVVLSKSAPTELALELAEELGITTVGFIRKHSLNVYTRLDRIVES